MSGDGLPLWALELAEPLMRPLGRRWDHVQAAARMASRIDVSGEAHRTALVEAALLHDIGYAPSLAQTGFHPLDGARYLRKRGHEQLALVVAHHSAARIEARLRGIENYEIEFPFQDSSLDHALTVCDMWLFAVERGFIGSVRLR